MEGSTVVGFMAVLAVSACVVLVNLQVHKRLVPEFMKKIELELGGKEKSRPKKKVQFAKDVVESRPKKTKKVQFAKDVVESRPKKKVQFAKDVVESRPKKTKKVQFARDVVESRPKKKVQFAKDVVEPSWNNKEYHYEQNSRLILSKDNRVMVTTIDNASSNHKNHDQLLEDNMPLNRRALYKGIMEYKALKAKGYSVHGSRNRKSWLSPS